jgi:hypothetical protein
MGFPYKAFFSIYFQMDQIDSDNLRTHLLHPLERFGGETDDKKLVHFSDISNNKNNLATSGYLKYKEHKIVRGLYIMMSQLLYFTLGAGYYSFPMWLNQIITKHVDITRETQSILG